MPSIQLDICSIYQMPTTLFCWKLSSTTAECFNLYLLLSKEDKGNQQSCVYLEFIMSKTFICILLALTAGYPSWCQTVSWSAWGTCLWSCFSPGRFSSERSYTVKWELNLTLECWWVRDYIYILRREEEWERKRIELWEKEKREIVVSSGVRKKRRQMV